MGETMNKEKGTTIKISKEVKQDVKKFIELNLFDWMKDAESYGCFKEYEHDDGPEYQITFGLSKDGKSWNYQTGDNSFTGGAYGFEHWAITYLYEGITVDSLYKEMIDQWDELIYQ